MRARRSESFVDAAWRRWLCLAAMASICVAWPSVGGAQADVSCEGRPTAKQVRSLRFEGNTTFSDDELSARVVTTASSFTHRHFRWLFNIGTARCLPDNGLTDDIEALKTFYKNNGFYQTKVVGRVDSLPPDQVDVAFLITEGPPLVLDKFAITGLDSVPDSTAIVRDLPIGPGRRVGLLLVYTAIDTITSRLRNAGYPQAEVFPGFTANASKQSASVELQVVTGARQRIGTIAIARGGPAPERSAQIDSLVVLHLLGFRPGDWYSDRAMNDARRNLYNLGAYRHVGIDLDTTEQKVDSLATVRVDLREDYLRQFQPEEGWAQLDCFKVEATYSDKNFLDRALRLDVTGRVSKLGFGYPTDWGPLCRRHDLIPDSLASSKLNYYAGATVRQPTLFGGKWVPEYSAYTERRGQYKSYLRTTYIGANLAATRNIAITTPLRFGYALEYGYTLAEPAFLCALFSRCTPAEQAGIQRKQPFAVASASLQQVRVDNTVEPRSGYIVGGEVRGASTFLGSSDSLQFFKVTASGSLYRPLSRRATLAFRIQGGVIGGTSLPPPQERLYAGGAASVRGFQQNLLGPLIYLVDSATKVTLPDSTVAFVTTPGTSALRTIPAGGNRLIVLNAEARIRDPFFPNALEYVPFVDAGEVYTSEAGNPGININLNRLSVTPGLGLRYFSPIGPIQVNAGYNPDRVRAGPAYITPLQPNGTAPLVCVTAPGSPLAPVKISKDGTIIGNVNSECPATFVPKVSSSFFSRFVVTLSIGTDF
jgi:outer membrane protein insertion porin family/translocation and assembly module TamA